jgi:hypothetical protein
MMPRTIARVTRKGSLSIPWRSAAVEGEARAMDADARHTSPKTLVVNSAVFRAVCCTRRESEIVHGFTAPGPG